MTPGGNCNLNPSSFSKEMKIHPFSKVQTQFDSLKSTLLKDEELIIEDFSDFKPVFENKISYTLTCKLNTGVHRKNGIVPPGTYETILAKFVQYCELDLSAVSFNEFTTFFELDSRCQLHTHSFFTQNGPKDHIYHSFNDFRHNIMKKDYPNYTLYLTTLGTKKANNKWNNYIRKQPGNWAKETYASLRAWKLNTKTKLSDAIIVKYRPKRFILDYKKVPTIDQYYIPKVNFIDFD